MNPRQIKALRALHQQNSYLAQYTNSAGWYVWIPEPQDNVYKQRMSLTCKDVHDLINQGYIVSQHYPSMRFLADKGREFVESLRSINYV